MLLAQVGEDALAGFADDPEGPSDRTGAQRGGILVPPASALPDRTAERATGALTWIQAIGSTHSVNRACNTSACSGYPGAGTGSRRPADY
jgi:hypothetical protein